MSTLACKACGVGHPASSAPLLCTGCRAVLPPVPGASPFARLGHAPRFAIDDAALEQAWLQRTRQVHPDRFARRPDAERRAAAEQTAALNDAWRALRGPFARATWLVRSAGVEEPRLPPALLVGFMEAREEAATSAAARARVVEGSVARFRVVMDQVAVELTAVDAAGGWERPPAEVVRVRRAAVLLGEARTLARLVADLGGPALIPGLEQR
jgi:molecular chaperone HscB